MSLNELDLAVNIWEFINQPNLKTFDDKNVSPLKEVDSDRLNQYFSQTSKYKIIDLEALSEEDTQLIKNKGLSLEYLLQNRSGSITGDGIQKEDFQHNGPRQINLPEPAANSLRETRFQVSCVEEGRIYAVCPSSGKIISSNRSFVLKPEKWFNESIIYYRFSGKEVFYLLTGRPGEGFLKACLYFPKTDLVVALYSNRLPRRMEQEFNMFKTFVVTNWEKIKSYLCNNNEVKTVVLLSLHEAMHHPLNELSGISKVHEYCSFEKAVRHIDKFLVVYDPVGPLGEIFPEIPPEKIKCLKDTELINEVLENNYFVCKLGWNFISEKLSRRIYQASLRQCSQAFLKEVEQARKTHFPIIWATLRLDNRAWISQIEGLANIINKLSRKFPDLAVIFDGYSVPHGYSDSPSMETAKEFDLFERLKNVVEKIRISLKPDIKTYSAIGHMIYESIVWTYVADLYISHWGCLLDKMVFFGNKPGVLHTNTNLPVITKNISPVYWRENALTPINIRKDEIKNVNNAEVSTGDLRRSGTLSNYDMDWEVVYKEALKLAMSICL